MKKNMRNLILFLFIILGIIIFSPLANAQTSYTNTNYTNSEQYMRESISSVTLNSSLNPGGYTTTAWFEYSLDPNFRTLNETEHKYVGSSNEEIPFGTTINNLIPNTIYYFRVITNNGRNTTKGNILSFTTKQNNISSNTNYSTTNARYVDNYINQTQPLNTTGYTNYQNQNNSSIYQNTNRVSNNNVANPLFANTFLPNNLGGWLVLFLIILIIIIVIRKLFKTNYSL